jgi:hypothetical protein
LGRSRPSRASTSRRRSRAFLTLQQTAARDHVTCGSGSSLIDSTSVAIELPSTVIVDFRMSWVRRPPQKGRLFVEADIVPPIRPQLGNRERGTRTCNDCRQSATQFDQGQKN